MYVNLMGAEGLAQSTRVAILNANYIAGGSPVLSGPLPGKRGAWPRVHPRHAHLKKSAGIEVDDIAKRLWTTASTRDRLVPVPSTMMIEPTESESKGELDRFCDAMISIREEIAEIEAGKQPKEDNLLVNAPHPADVLTADAWTHPYSGSAQRSRGPGEGPQVLAAGRAPEQRPRRPEARLLLPPIEAYEE